MIGIIDYGIGNLKSIINAIKFNSDVKVEIVNTPEELKNYSKFILPGVGAFGDAMKKIKENNFDVAIHEEVKKGNMLLGLCLGMQLLATKSFEFGEHNGLNLIEGEIRPFKEFVKNVRIPHIGWNNVKFCKSDAIIKDIENSADFYFVHSYFFHCKNSSNTLGTTQYGLDFTSIIHNNNIYGTQFHPEKSQEYGLKLIKNFINL